MTTIAFDGRNMAADTLSVDDWGLIDHTPDKIKRGVDFLCGGAGDLGQIEAWWAAASSLTLAGVLQYGYPDYEKGGNDPGILLVSTAGEIWSLISAGIFTRQHRGYHAIGSGRDYALAAMHLGKTAKRAIEVAMAFDNHTGGSIIVKPLAGRP